MEILSKYVKNLKDNFGIIMNLILLQSVLFSNYTNNYTSTLPEMFMSSFNLHFCSVLIF